MLHGLPPQSPNHKLEAGKHESTDAYTTRYGTLASISSFRQQLVARHLYPKLYELLCTGYGFQQKKIRVHEIIIKQLEFSKLAHRTGEGDTPDIDQL